MSNCWLKKKNCNVAQHTCNPIISKGEEECNEPEKRRDPIKKELRNDPNSVVKY